MRVGFVNPLGDRLPLLRLRFSLRRATLFNSRETCFSITRKSDLSVATSDARVCNLLIKATYVLALVSKAATLSVTSTTTAAAESTLTSADTDTVFLLGASDCAESTRLARLEGVGLAPASLLAVTDSGSTLTTTDLTSDTTVATATTGTSCFDNFEGFATVEDAEDCFGWRADIILYYI